MFFCCFAVVVVCWWLLFCCLLLLLQLLLLVAGVVVGGVGLAGWVWLAGFVQQLLLVVCRTSVEGAGGPTVQQCWLRLWTCVHVCMCH